MARVYIPLYRASTAFIVDVFVDNSPIYKKKLALRGGTPPERLPSKALIDTGATLCAVSERLAEELELPATSAKQFPVHTSNGTLFSHRYSCAFSFQEDESWGSSCIVVSRFKLQDCPFDFIIGMNYLENLGISYMPFEKGLWLSNPPE